jgi:hypothetical protein
VPGRLNKVYACMDAVVNNVHTIHLILCVEIGIKALFNVIDNRSP